VQLLISSNPAGFKTVEILLLSFLLNLFITGVFAFAGFAYQTSKVLPDSYYLIKNPVFLKQLYKFIGVKYFRIFLLVLFWGKKNNRAKY
jgi:hypothetical protein